jgi:hypothetical protein
VGSVLGVASALRITSDSVLVTVVEASVRGASTRGVLSC